MNQFDKIVQRLEHDWPDWQVWYVPRAVSQPRILWCARRWDGIGETINADSADELAECLADQTPS
jgi:hypothetical protein